MSPRQRAGRGHLRYLRRNGNRMVRARRRRRTALRMVPILLLWAGAAAGAWWALGFGARWATSPVRFRLETVMVRGTHEARESEIQELVGHWMGRNIFTITLTDVEKKVREHPWIGAPGSAGSVRVQRRLPGSLLVTVSERKAGGMALWGEAVYLLDETGLPIDRHGPRYAAYDFPIIKGLDSLMTGPDAGGTGLKEALATGVEVTRALAEREPAFYAQVSEIDISEPHAVVVRLEDEAYDLRLSREDPLMNLTSYFALRDGIKDEEGGDIEYVDLRWQDRVVVMPAVAAAGREKRNGGR